MAKYTLTIETNDPVELADITAAIAEEQAVDRFSPEGGGHSIPITIEEPKNETPKARRGRPAKASASAVEEVGETVDPVVATSGESIPLTTASHSEPATNEAVSAQDCKDILLKCMDQGISPNALQGMMNEKFGVGSIMKIDPAKYPALKAELQGLLK